MFMFSNSYCSFIFDWLVLCMNCSLRELLSWVVVNQLNSTVLPDDFSTIRLGSDVPPPFLSSVTFCLSTSRVEESVLTAELHIWRVGGACAELCMQMRRVHAEIRCSLWGDWQVLATSGKLDFGVQFQLIKPGGSVRTHFMFSLM